MTDFDLLLLLLFGASPQLKAVLAIGLASLLFGPALYIGGGVADLWRRLRRP